MDRAVVLWKHEAWADLVRTALEVLNLDENHPMVNRMMGQCFCYGWGVAKDLGRARELTEKAYRLGDVEAAVSLGCLCLEEGRFVEARELIAGARRGGHPSAAHGLGALCYLEGKAALENGRIDAAEYHFKKARELLEDALQGGIGDVVEHLAAVSGELTELRALEALMLSAWRERLVAGMLDASSSSGAR